MACDIHLQAICSRQARICAACRNFWATSAFRQPSATPSLAWKASFRPMTRPIRETNRIKSFQSSWHEAKLCANDNKQIIFRNFSAPLTSPRRKKFMGALVTGHMNPDTDSIISAIAATDLYSKRGFDVSAAAQGKLCSRKPNLS